MKNRLSPLTKLKLTCLVMLGALLPMAFTTPILAASPPDTLLNGAQNSACQGVGFGANGCGNATDNSSKLSAILTDVLNILSIIVGIAAVIVIFVQGLRFIVSGGEPGAVTSARNGVLYAVVGIVLAAVAQLIVHFVLAKAAPPPPKTGLIVSPNTFMLYSRWYIDLIR